jgi:hypothetical protein
MRVRGRASFRGGDESSNKGARGRVSVRVVRAGHVRDGGESFALWCEGVAEPSEVTRASHTMSGERRAVKYVVARGSGA